MDVNLLSGSGFKQAGSPFMKMELEIFRIIYWFTSCILSLLRKFIFYILSVIL